ARRHAALTIVDNIHAGSARTGGFFCSADIGFVPDIGSRAKSLSSIRLPFPPARFRPGPDHWSPPEHNGTFLGIYHAFVTAAAALRHFWSDGQFQQDVARRSGMLERRLDAMAAEHGLSTRGRGMMRGIDLGSGEIAGTVTATCFERGL